MSDDVFADLAREAGTRPSGSSPGGFSGSPSRGRGGGGFKLAILDPQCLRDMGEGMGNVSFLLIFSAVVSIMPAILIHGSIVGFVGYLAWSARGKGWLRKETIPLILLLAIAINGQYSAAFSGIGSSLKQGTQQIQNTVEADVKEVAK